MASRFRNPSNGYEENVGEAWLWCLLLGPVCFAAKGIWLHAATSLLLAIGTGGVSWFIYPFFANWTVRKHFLRMGWLPEKSQAMSDEDKRRVRNQGLGLVGAIAAIGLVGAIAAISGSIFHALIVKPSPTKGTPTDVMEGDGSKPGWHPVMKMGKLDQGRTVSDFENRERHCLATAIYFEAHGWPISGQVAVGQVIMNRVRSPNYPETICGSFMKTRCLPTVSFPLLVTVAATYLKMIINGRWPKISHARLPMARFGCLPWVTQSR